MSVRVSPISRTAAILIIILGAFTLLAGWAADEFASEGAGAGIVVLGVFLYWLLFRLTRRIASDFEAATKD